NIGASVPSGSHPADAMIVIPCSVRTLARIANGIASHLIERAADVCLKETRQLVLCVRETPLNKIHIRNMYRAADAGATIFPLIPAYYFRPRPSTKWHRNSPTACLPTSAYRRRTRIAGRADVRSKSATWVRLAGSGVRLVYGLQA